jgi:hypothetical protein
MNLNVNMKRVGAVVGVVAGLMILFGIDYVRTHSGHPGSQDFQDLPGLLSAIQAFARDTTNRGQPLPQSLSLHELVSRGYISSNSIRAFEGMEARVWLRANPTLTSSEVLMSARLPDGRVCAALADGSVQEFSARSFAQHLKRAGQQDGAANGSQPVAAQTNGTSGAAGSRR